MAQKKSKALEAARKIQGTDDEPPPSRWTRSMVERAIVVFNDIERIPPFEEENIRARVRDFLRFVARVEQGGVEDDATALAHAYIDRGYAWLAQNPRYAPVTTTPWSAAMVEELVLWFNDATSGARDKRRALDVAEKLHTFELVVRSGAVEPGEAEALAEAFLEYGHRWLASQPDAQAHYEQLA